MLILSDILKKVDSDPMVMIVMTHELMTLKTKPELSIFKYHIKIIKYHT